METQSAFATKVRTLQIGASQARALFDLMLVDISSGVLELIEVAPAHFVAAASLVWKYGFERRMRTLDAIQMAVALGSSFTRTDGCVRCCRQDPG